MFDINVVYMLYAIQEKRNTRLQAGIPHIFYYYSFLAWPSLLTSSVVPTKHSGYVGMHHLKNSKNKKLSWQYSSTIIAGICREGYT